MLSKVKHYTYHVPCCGLVPVPPSSTNSSVFSEAPIPLLPMRVFAMSDLHTDFRGNMQWLTNFELEAGQAHKGDILILPGDISHCVDILSTTLSILVRVFRIVVFTPGNHELWVVKSSLSPIRNGAHKLLHVIKLCEQLGVIVGPVVLHPSDQLCSCNHSPPLSSSVSTSSLRRPSRTVVIVPLLTWSFFAQTVFS